MKMPTIVGIFIFMSRKYANVKFHISKQRNFHAQLCLARENVLLLVIRNLLAGQISCSAELNTKKVF